MLCLNKSIVLDSQDDMENNDINQDTIITEYTHTETEFYEVIGIDLLPKNMWAHLKLQLGIWLCFFKVDYCKCICFIAGLGRPFNP